MERKKYLEMCQKVAMLSNGIFGTKQNVPDDLKVVYDGTVYYPFERVAKFDNQGNLILSARLHDLKSNCVVEALLKDVEEYKNENFENVN